MKKEKNNKDIIGKILDEGKGIIAYQTDDPEAPIYYNNKINVLDDLESEKLSSWKKVKKYMKGLYKKSNSLFFISHKEDEIIGKPQLIEKYQKKVILSLKSYKRNHYDLDEEIINYKFLDENFNRRDEGQEKEVCALWFWIYKVVYKSKEYIVLSQKELTPDLYRFRGMKITLNDNSEVTKTLKFKSLSQVFISVEEDKAIKTLGKKELIEHIKKLKEGYGLTQEKFKEQIFTNSNNKVYLHTPNYTKIVLSFLLSGKYEGYPLHLLIIAPQGTGKTTKLECLDNLFNESCGIFEAGNSTLKGLIPSHKEKPLNVGYILNCVRIGLIDELFKMIESAETGRYVEMLSNYFSKLNMLLEHKHRTIGSGTDTIKVQSTAKLLLVTNPYRKKRTIFEHISLMDITTLSRFVPIVQDIEERKLIAEKNIYSNENKKITREEFLSIYDSCQSFLCGYDGEKVKEIWKKSLNLINNSMVAVWKARGLHHSILLLDGIVKFRCMFQGDTSFKAKSEDYAELEKLVEYIIRSWDCPLRDWDTADRF